MASEIDELELFDDSDDEKELITRFPEDYGVKKTLHQLVSLVFPGLFAPFGSYNAKQLVSIGHVSIDNEVRTKLSTGFYGKPGYQVEVVTVEAVYTRQVAATYWLFHKPIGCITAMKDIKHRTVGDCLRESNLYEKIFHENVVPVGRLDLNTTGLLLCTNDGLLSVKALNRVTHLAKTYRCTLRNEPTIEDVEELAKGVEISLPRGKIRKCLPARVILHPTVLVDKEMIYTADIIIAEGAHHQVKRMWMLRGNRVLKLERIAFGPLVLNDLSPGQIRSLSIEEIRSLYEAVDMENSFYSQCLNIPKVVKSEIQSSSDSFLDFWPSNT